MRDPFAHRVLMVVGITAASILLILFVWQAITVLLVLFGGILFGTILVWGREQVSHYLRLPPGLALALVILLVLSFFAALVVSIAPMIREQISTLSQEFPDYLRSLESFLESVYWGRELMREAPDTAGLLEALQTEGDIIGRIWGVFSTTVGALVGLVLIIFIGIYLAAEPELYINGVLRLVPMERRQRARQVLERLGHTLRWWMLGQMLSMFILGVLTTIVLAALGVPYALALGLLAAIMTFIPNLGPVLAAIPTLLVALALDPRLALYVLMLYVLIQNIEGYFITPMVHRRIIQMPPVVILIVQLLLLTMVGFIGVLLAMPLVACAMVLVQMLYIEDVLGDSFERPP